MNVALLKSANMKIEDTEAHKLLVLELESDLYKVAMESQEVLKKDFFWSFTRGLRERTRSD